MRRLTVLGHNLAHDLCSPAGNLIQCITPFPSKKKKNPLPWQHPCCHPVTPLRRCGVVGHAVLLRGYSDEPGSRLLLASTVLECCGVMVSSSVNWTSPQTAVRWPVVNVSRYLPGLPHYVRV
jgi:hypothetical protein